MHGVLKRVSDGPSVVTYLPQAPSSLGTWSSSQTHSMSAPVPPLHSMKSPHFGLVRKHFWYTRRPANPARRVSITGSHRADNR